MLRVEDIWFRYSRDRWILRGVTFNIGRGIHCVVGPNGCGKTTLLRIVIGGLRPQRGRIVAYGKRIRRMKDAVGVMVYVPSNPMMFLVGPRVRDEIERAYRASDISPSDVIDLLSLRDIMDMRIFELSEGQRHVVAIASAILHGARIIVLDEPTIGLDREYRTRILRALRMVSGRRIILVASNDMRLIRRVDSLLLLSNGIIVMHDKPAHAILREEFPFSDDIAMIMRKLGILPSPREGIADTIRRMIC